MPQIPSLKDVKFRINQLVQPTSIEAIKARHILLQSESLAHDCHRLLSNPLNSTTESMEVIDFTSLAKSLSLCELTKDRGGEFDWMDEQKDECVFPIEVINTLLGMKKGDLKIVSSTAGWHIVQLLDVVTKLSPLAKRRKLEYVKALQESGRKLGKSLRYRIDTMGCQMNVADSERMEGQLKELGYQPVTDRQASEPAHVDQDEADVFILNTCSIRDHAEQKVYSYLGPIAARKRRGEDVSIIVAGCVAQQEGEKLLRRFPEVDVIMGPQYANRLGDLLTSAMEGYQLVATDPSYQMEDTVPALRKSDVSAYVNVIYGCNERCTYCVVPTTRGVEQSRIKESIVAEVEELAANGYKEVTLLGQNIDSWGR
jgi:hypothetical protein